MAAELKVACIQMCSGEDIPENLDTAARLIGSAANQGATLVQLPETFACITQNSEIRQHAALQAGHITDFLKQQAQQWGVWLIGGSLLSPVPNSVQCHNRCYLISPRSEIAATYNKMHLFDAQLTHENWKESNYIAAGDTPTCHPLDDPWKLGLSICYDLRFPEFYRYYRQQDCNLLSVPAAFTATTGKAHWQTLLQARAIENQCYVMAAGQSGTHADGRQTWGHSMIIDPWGEILAEAEQDQQIIMASLSYPHLQSVRSRMNVKPQHFHIDQI